MYIWLHNNKLLSFTKESVNIDLEMEQNIPFYPVASAFLGGYASNGLWKHGADEAAAGSNSVKQTI